MVQAHKSFKHKSILYLYVLLLIYVVNVQSIRSVPSRVASDMCYTCVKSQSQTCCFACHARMLGNTGLESDKVPCLSGAGMLKWPNSTATMVLQGYNCGYKLEANSAMAFCSSWRNTMTKSIGSMRESRRNFRKNSSTNYAQQCSLQGRPNLPAALVESAATARLMS